MNRIDLSTRYLGLALKHPIVASASPLTGSIDSLKRLQEAGIAAVVLKSLFEEQIRHDMAALDHFLSFGTESVGEATSYLPTLDECDVGPTQYLELIRKAGYPTRLVLGVVVLDRLPLGRGELEHGIEVVAL